jgi:hypothetical protein
MAYGPDGRAPDVSLECRIAGGLARSNVATSSAAACRSARSTAIVIARSNFELSTFVDESFELSTFVNESFERFLRCGVPACALRAEGGA